MTVSEWQKRLEDHFTVNGVIGGHLLDVMHREGRVGSVIVKFRGQMALIDSFQSFFVETLESAIGSIAKNGWPEKATNYPTVLAWYLTLFRRYRACQILFTKGYPLDGYALMRDIKDRAILTAGVVHNMTSFPQILGTVDSTYADPDEFLKKTTAARRKEESRIRRRILGDKSGLTRDTVFELRQWENLFHLEVHSGILSLAQQIRRLAHGIEVATIGPTLERDALAMFMNRSAEVGWLIVRLLPYLQPTVNAFGATWQNKQAVLDDSFRFIVKGLRCLGKKIGDAVVTLVDEKFSFRQPLSYVESDGRAYH